MHSKQHNIFCKNVYIKMRGDFIFRCKGQSWPQGWIISSNATFSYLFIFQGGGRLCGEGGERLGVEIKGNKKARVIMWARE